jgi:hypothetical protein
MGGNLLESDRSVTGGADNANDHDLGPAATEACYLVNIGMNGRP